MMMSLLGDNGVTSSSFGSNTYSRSMPCLPSPARRHRLTSSMTKRRNGPTTRKRANRLRRSKYRAIGDTRQTFILGRHMLRPDIYEHNANRQATHLPVRFLLMLPSHDCVAMQRVKYAVQTLTSLKIRRRLKPSCGFAVIRMCDNTRQHTAKNVLHRQH